MRSMKKLLVVLALLLITYGNSAYSEISNSNSGTESNKHLIYGYPGKTNQIICRDGYVLEHDPIKKVPLWVSYQLTSEDLKGTQERTDNFKQDPLIIEGRRAELSDYYKSGYDRGHMAPAGDMKRSYKVMADSFYLSNICPQLAGLNRGIWKDLENRVRDIVRDVGEATIICGPLFKDMDGDGNGDYIERIGPGKVWVPTHYYKIIVYEEGELISVFAFIMENKAISGSLETYITTIDRIELLAELDFLSELPDSLEDDIESKEPSGLGFLRNNNEEYAKTDLLVNGSKENQKGVELIYHGNINSKIFHHLGCEYYNCYNCTRIFKSIKEAMRAGYRPCKICKSMDKYNPLKSWYNFYFGGTSYGNIIIEVLFILILVFGFIKGTKKTYTTMYIWILVEIFVFSLNRYLFSATHKHNILYAAELFFFEAIPLSFFYGVLFGLIKETILEKNERKLHEEIVELRHSMDNKDDEANRLGMEILSLNKQLKQIDQLSKHKTAQIKEDIKKKEEETKRLIVERDEELKKYFEALISNDIDYCIDGSNLVIDNREESLKEVNIERLRTVLYELHIKRKKYLLMFDRSKWSHELTKMDRMTLNELVFDNYKYSTGKVYISGFADPVILNAVNQSLFSCRVITSDKYEDFSEIYSFITKPDRFRKPIFNNSGREVFFVDKDGHRRKL